MNLNKLISLETEMESTDVLSFYEEGFYTEGVDTAITSFMTKASAVLKKIIIQMKTFSREIHASITQAITTASLHAVLSKYKKALKNGQVVYVPDIENIIEVYDKYVNDLIKEIQSIAKYLNKDRHFWRSPANLKKYEQRKDDLAIEIDEMIIEIAEKSKQSIKIDPGPKGEKKAEALLKLDKVNLCVEKYGRLIREMEKATILFEKELAMAEIDYSVRQATKIHMSALKKLQVGSTKLLRKTVFAILVAFHL